MLLWGGLLVLTSVVLAVPIEHDESVSDDLVGLPRPPSPNHMPDCLCDSFTMHCTLCTRISRTVCLRRIDGL
jgi:hypothetical protein